jgi:large subunit ribosomal protein L13
MSTYTPKASEITRAWHVVDAEGMVLGRLCTEVARVLRGKHKTTFVIVINADKIQMTSNKVDRTFKYRHSGYPGGIKSATYSQLLDRKPADAVRSSIKGMLPKGPLGRQQMTKLKIYAGGSHPHEAQQPQPLTIPGAQARG